MGGAVDTLGRGLAVDLAPVRVNVIAPGVVKTEVGRISSRLITVLTYFLFAVSVALGRLRLPERSSDRDIRRDGEEAACKARR